MPREARRGRASGSSRTRARAFVPGGTLLQVIGKERELPGPPGFSAYIASSLPAETRPLSKPVSWSPDTAGELTVKFPALAAVALRKKNARAAHPRKAE